MVQRKAQVDLVAGVELGVVRTDVVEHGAPEQHAMLFDEVDPFAARGVLTSVLQRLDLIFAGMIATGDQPAEVVVEVAVRSPSLADDRRGDIRRNVLTRLEQSLEPTVGEEHIVLEEADIVGRRSRQGCGSSIAAGSIGRSKDDIRQLSWSASTAVIWSR